MSANQHPIQSVGIKASGFKSFGERGIDVEKFLPINILIGKNNTGKSTLIDLLEACTIGNVDLGKFGRLDASFSLEIYSCLTEESVRTTFPPGTSSSAVPGSNYWEYGSKFVNYPVLVKFDDKLIPVSLTQGPDFADLSLSRQREFRSALAQAQISPFKRLRLLRIAADRDVSPEGHNKKLNILSDGRGTTNTIRGFINSDNYPRSAINRTILTDLNKIFEGDSKFSSISCQESDNGIWEVFLEDDAKGDIRLSHSGSSLKSILIILCQLRLTPLLDKFKLSNYLLAIEEPENNLHPALLRRLLNFLADEQDENKFCMFISTHSPIVIDWASRRNDSQILHVRHDGKEASISSATRYLDNRAILDDLDIRASDILQSNCVIWVEGPSDRIYLRRWLAIISNDLLKEGVHYSIMFYGGKLLCHLELSAPDEADNLISLLSINRNAAILIDSDISKPEASNNPRPKINKTKERIRSEVVEHGGFEWITEGKEIENYISPHVAKRVLQLPADIQIPKFGKVIEMSEFSNFKGDKISLAHSVAEQTFSPSDIDVLGLKIKVEALANQIKVWNGI